MKLRGLFFRGAPKDGMALLATAGVLVVIGVAAIAARGFSQTASQDLDRVADTQHRLQVVSDALVAYLGAHQVFPCPADGSVSLRGDSAAQAGSQAASAGMCTTGGTIRAVPFSDLGLPAEAALDGWGRKISYYVDPGCTVVPSFASTAVCGSATALSVGSAAAQNTAVVLVSHGVNGFYAFPAVGGASAIAAPDGPLASGVAENGNTALNTVYRTAGDPADMANTLIAAEPARQFGDIVMTISATQVTQMIERLTGRTVLPQVSFSKGSVFIAPANSSSTGTGPQLVGYLGQIRALGAAANDQAGWLDVVRVRYLSPRDPVTGAVTALRGVAAISVAAGPAAARQSREQYAVELQDGQDAIIVIGSATTFAGGTVSLVSDATQTVTLPSALDAGAQATYNPANDGIASTAVGSGATQGVKLTLGAGGSTLVTPIAAPTTATTRVADDGICATQPAPATPVLATNACQDGAASCTWRSGDTSYLFGSNPPAYAAVTAMTGRGWDANGHPLVRVRNTNPEGVLPHTYTLVDTVSRARVMSIVPETSADSWIVLPPTTSGATYDVCDGQSFTTRLVVPAPTSSASTQ